MHVRYLPQTILDKLPIELWLQIQNINDVQFEKRQDWLKEKVRFVGSIILEGIKRKGRSLFSSQRFRYSTRYDFYTRVMQILAFNGKHMVKMVVEFDVTFFYETLYLNYTYMEFLRRKNRCRILIHENIPIKKLNLLVK